MRRTQHVLWVLARELHSRENVVGLQLLNEPQPHHSLEEWYSSTIDEIRRVAPTLPLYIHDAWDTAKYASFVGRRAESDFVVVDHHLYRCFTSSDQTLSGDEHARALHANMNGELADALVLTSDAESLLLDLATDLVEIGVAFVYVEELAPFCDIGVAFGGRGVDELEDERSAGDDAGATGEEVAADDAGSGIRRDGRTRITRQIRTFRGHWTFLQTDCLPEALPQLLSDAQIGRDTYHSQLGHVQLSAWRHVRLE